MNTSPNSPEGSREPAHLGDPPFVPGLLVNPSASPRPTWLPSTLHSLRHRNYRLFFFGQLISLIGSMMQGAAINWLIYDLTGSKDQLGIINALRAVPIVLFTLLGGVMADRYSKRRILIITQASLMMIAFALSAVVMLGVLQVWHIIVVSMLFGAVLAFDIPTRQAFVVELVGEDDLSNAIALNSSMFNLANVLGPAAGGLVMAGVGAAWCFFINAVTFLAVIGGLLMMRIAERPRPQSRASAFRQVTEGLSIVMRQRRLRNLLSFVAVMGVFGMSYNVLMPVFAKDVLRVTERGYGILLSANGVGAVIGALVVATLARTNQKSSFIAGGAILFSVALFLFGSSTSFLVSGLCLIAVGVGWIFMMSTANSVVQNSVPHAVRGRVMAIWALVFVGAMPVGSLEAGKLATWRSAPAAVQIGAIICGASALYAFYSVVIRRRARGRLDADAGPGE